MASLEESVKYCHERKTFGKEIGQHQLVQQMIAKMESGIANEAVFGLRSGELEK